jgi:hypothetical protein
MGKFLNEVENILGAQVGSIDEKKTRGRKSPATVSLMGKFSELVYYAIRNSKPDPLHFKL